MRYAHDVKLTQLNALLAFVTVAEKRGFSAAARALGVSASALSQSVRSLEDRVGVPLLVRTTRSVNVTEAGRRLLERSAGGLREALDAIDEAASRGGEVQGKLRISVPGITIPILVEPLLPLLVQSHPGLELEISVDDRFVDLIAEGYDAGFRLGEAIHKDMVAIRVTPPFRFVVVGSPAYLTRKGRPKKPRDLLKHECIGYRGMTSGALYAWEFQQGKRELEIATRGSVVCNDARIMVAAALRGLGLAYLHEQAVAAHLAEGRLEIVLEAFAPSVPGLFLHCPARAQTIPKVRALIDALRALASSP
ncbi:LysR family transcriptional regulator [Pendulispora albinea]|uniref:LysR family transcriptional regulator n=1 Tax=Pendulispora albinea TaxID=2741071 RepID=A0ABZ2M7T4_9BACT